MAAEPHRSQASLHNEDSLLVSLLSEIFHNTFWDLLIDFDFPSTQPSLICPLFLSASYWNYSLPLQFCTDRFNSNLLYLLRIITVPYEQSFIKAASALQV